MIDDQIISKDIQEIVNDLKEIIPSLENKSILITGGRGFLGTYFLKTFLKINQLLTKPMQIFVIDNLITSKDDVNQYPNVVFIESDISKKIEINEPINYIIHSASIASPPMYRKFPLKTIDVNSVFEKSLLKKSKTKKLKIRFFSRKNLKKTLEVLKQESLWM